MKTIINFTLLLASLTVFSQEKIDTLDDVIISIPSIIYLKSTNYINLMNLNADTVSIDFYNRFGNLIITPYNGITSNNTKNLKLPIETTLLTEDIYFYVVQVNDESLTGILHASNDYKKEITIINNPFHHSEDIELEVKGYKNQTIDITIFDSSGKIISSESDILITEDSTQYFINTANLDAGDYTLQADDQSFKITSYGKVLALEENRSKVTSIYPNPASETLYINSKLDIKSVNIFDSNGKLVLTSQTKEEIPINNLVKGVYMVKISTLDQEYQERIVIE